MNLWPERPFLPPMSAAEYRVLVYVSRRKLRFFNNRSENCRLRTDGVDAESGLPLAGRRSNGTRGRMDIYRMIGTNGGKRTAALRGRVFGTGIAGCARRWVSGGLLAMLLASGFSAPHSVSAQDYRLGQGLWIGKLNLAGYLTVEGEAARGEDAKLIIDDLSLFVQGRFNRWINPFLEAEAAGVPLVTENHGLFQGEKSDIVLERFYNDIVIDDRWSLRLGKALTPVGEWNGIHAGPLVETTSRPLTTFRGFSEFYSGAALLYEAANERLPDLTIYWQPGGELASNPEAVPGRLFHDMAGINLSWHWGLGNTLGLSYQRARVAKTSERQQLLGVNFHFARGPFALLSEFTYLRLHRPLLARVRRNEIGLYVQGQWHLGEEWSLVSRFEVYRDRDVLRTARNVVVGISWRPRPPIVWKIEYLDRWGGFLDIRTGVRGSFNILF